MAKGFQKGHSGFREKGVPNKTTGKARELFLEIIEGQSEHLLESLNQLRQEDTAEYLNVVCKMMPYVLPKKSEIDLSAQQDITIRFDFDMPDDNEDNRV